MDQLGFARVTDNVERMRSLLECRPDIEITHFRHPSWHYTAVWFDRGIRHEILDRDLGGLMDQLDALGLGA